MPYNTTATVNSRNDGFLYPIWLKVIMDWEIAWPRCFLYYLVQKTLFIVALDDGIRKHSPVPCSSCWFHEGLVCDLRREGVSNRAESSFGVPAEYTYSVGPDRYFCDAPARLFVANSMSRKKSAPLQNSILPSIGVSLKAVLLLLLRRRYWRSLHTTLKYSTRHYTFSAHKYPSWKPVL